MAYAYCDGSMSAGGGGEVICSGTWQEVATDQVLAAYSDASSLSSEDFAELFGAAVLILVTAFCLRYVRRMFGG